MIKEAQKPHHIISIPKYVPLISCDDFFEIDKIISFRNKYAL